ncbi:unnamed protein product [Trichobilharzia regenti]|nr:unnamed protein product [Trichobilharzia regenti]
MNLSSESLSNHYNNHALNLPASDSSNGQFASITDDTDMMSRVNSENDIKPQQYQQLSLPSMTLMATAPTTTETSATPTSTTSATTRKRTPSSSSTAFSNQENNKSSKLLKIDSLSQMTVSSPNKNNHSNKTKQTTNSGSSSSTQAPIDDLNEDERQSLFDIAKAATAVMLLASSNSSPYRQNRTRRAKMPISPIRKNNNNNNNNNNSNVKSKVTSPNSKLHRSITPSQKKALISACKSHENLSSDKMKSLAQDLCLPYKTVSCIYLLVYCISPFSFNYIPFLSTLWLVYMIPLGKEGKSIDKVVKLYRFRWLEYVLSMPSLHLLCFEQF